MDLIEEIRSQKDRIGREIKPEICPRCTVAHDKGFSMHDIRKRQWLMVVLGTVLRIASAISRWKCNLCGSRFTLYPAFAQPGWRFVKQTVEEQSKAYLEEEKATTWSACCHEGIRIEHEPPKELPPPKNLPLLSRSTLWRWTQWWGREGNGLERMLDWILRAAPAAAIARFCAQIAPHKYRSEGRRQRLCRARHLLRALPIFRTLVRTLDSPRNGTPAPAF